MNGIHLFFSSAIDSLSALLAQSLRDEQRAGDIDIFVPSTVIVPNPALRRWLQLETARHNGMAVNIRFAFLEQGLWDLLETLSPEDTPVSMIDMGFMHKLVFQEIVRRCGSEEDKSGFPRAFRAFVQTPGREDIDEQRAWQLSGSLAGLFMEYEIHRPEMTEAWRRGEDWFPEDHHAASLEQAQRTVYHGALESAGEAGSRAGTTFLTLPALAARVFSDRSGHREGQSTDQGETHALVRSIHIFCPSQLSRFHTELICRLGQFHDVRLYSLNVCREFWEDVETDGERRMRLRKMRSVYTEDHNEELPFPEDENPLLAGWGKPGRETLKIFSDLEDRFVNSPVRFETTWLDSDSGIALNTAQHEQTLLGRIKHAIITRSSVPVSGPQDRSVQIAAAPGIEREVQAVWNSIVASMEEKPGLKFSDIAVLVPDMSRYRAVIQQVFDAPLKSGARRLVPWSLIDSSALLESVYAQGVNALLGIMGGEFTRAELFTLFQNPCFMERWSVDAAGVDTWLQWCADINIFRGTDTPFDYSCDSNMPGKARMLSPDREEAACIRRFSWKPGLQRLRLGKIMDGFSRDGIRSFSGLLPHPGGGSDAFLSGALSLAVESLAAWRREMRSASQPVSWWRERLPELLDAFLQVPADMRAEQGVKTGLMEGIRELAAFDIMPHPVSLTLRGILEYIKGILVGIPGGRGGYITGGVTVASLLPMRPIPFRHVYVLGLDQETFPGTDPVNPLDLVRRMRRIGDVSLPERNAFLFLETLVTVRERLFLSWVGRDVRQDREYEPSSVITSLRSFMDFDFEITEIPLKAWSPLYLAHDSKAPHSWLNCYSPHHYMLSMLELPAEMRPSMEEFPAGAVSPYTCEDTCRDTCDQGKDAADVEETSVHVSEHESQGMQPVEIRQYQLVEFLKNPALAWIRRDMGLRLPDEDEAMVEDEPFELYFFGKSDVFRRAVLHTLPHVMSHGVTPDYAMLEEQVRHIMAEMGQAWRAPALIYEKMEQEHITGEVEGLFSEEDFQQELTRLAALGITPVMNVQIGDGITDGPAGVSFPSAVTSAGLTFHGQIGCALMRDNRLCGAVVPVYSVSSKAKLSHALLESFIFYCIGVAGGIIEPETDFILLMPSPSELRKIIFRASSGNSDALDQEGSSGFVSADHVQEYLACLVYDMKLYMSDMIPLSIVEQVKLSDCTDISVRAGHETDLEAVSGRLPMEVDRMYVTPETAACYWDLVRKFVQENVLGDDYNRDRHAELYSLVKPEIPGDVFHKVRRRFAPLWYYIEDDS